MNSLKPIHWAGLVLGVAFLLYLLYSHLQDFGDVSFLGGILLLEILIASLWKYEQRFFGLLMIAFLWAGMHVPFQNAWTGGRWVVLGVGATVGYLIWMKDPRSHFRLIHLIASFCVFAAFVSASVSSFPKMAAAKALSLFLLFLYGSLGARLAAVGREERFFNGLLLACEIATFGTAICYLGLGESIWGNPNSLGAAMSIGVFPVLLWGWLTSEGSVGRNRRLGALLLCGYLILFSMARAGMIAMIVVTLTLCVCLRQYKLLTKVLGLALLVLALTGMVAPATLNKTVSDFRDAVFYKGHKDEGLLGSRMTPWQATIAQIKGHPWFGTGYGTSPNGEDPGLEFGKFASTYETVGEHGSSYMTLAEWVGLLGIVPFVVLLALTLANVWRVCAWMRRTGNPRHYSIPLAMVLLAGFLHANFEDWLFAIGAYPCVYFWTFAFLLADLIPSTAAQTSAVFAPTVHPARGYGAAIPNR